jgi:hypothetical protein
MYRYLLLPDLLDAESTQQKIWRRVLYSVVLTSVEFFLAVVAVLVGVPVLIDPVALSLASGSLVHLLPFWLVDLWGGQFTLGGLITIWGITTSDFRIEQIGTLLLMTGAFVYALALSFILPASWIAFVTYLLFVLAMGARYWVLGRLIKLTGRLRKRAIHNAEKGV